MVLVIATGFAVAATLLVEVRHPRWRRLPKMVASSGFVAVGLAVGALDSTYGRLVLGALALSWVGDLLLTYPGSFIGGLGAFLLAHVAYIAAFVRRTIGWLPALVGAGVVAIAARLVWRWVRPHLDRAMVGPVAAYVIVISVMVAAAFGAAGYRGDWLIGVGAVAFFASDLAVARNRFVAPGFANRAWGLPLYYLGQVLLALSTAMV